MTQIEYGISDWSDFYKYAVSQNKVFGSFVKVNAVYCLDGEPSHDGVYIYYDTDDGQYVLYKSHLSAEKTYLFPISDFYEFSEEVNNERRAKKDLIIGFPSSIEELCDVEDYVLKPKIDFYFMTIAIIVAFVLGAVGGECCYYVDAKQGSPCNSRVDFLREIFTYEA